VKKKAIEAATANAAKERKEVRGMSVPLRAWKGLRYGVARHQR
jgi:hypothetical protein